MPIITKISSQKSKKRVNLYLDGKFFCGLDLSVALKHSLKVGQEFSEEKIAALVNQSLKEELFQKALNFISYRPRSEKEVRDYLLRASQRRKTKLKPAFAGGLSTPVYPEYNRRARDDKGLVALINQSIKRLKKNNFLNDHDFAKWWVGQRLEFRPKGKIALKAELFKKGIDKNIIDEVLKEVSSKSELEAAKKVFEKAMKQLRSVKPEKRRQRLISRLSSRGFSWEIIKQVIDENNLWR